MQGVSRASLVAVREKLDSVLPGRVEEGRGGEAAGRRGAVRRRGAARRQRSAATHAQRSRRGRGPPGAAGRGPVRRPALRAIVRGREVAGRSVLGQADRPGRRRRRARRAGVVRDGGAGRRPRRGRGRAVPVRPHPGPRADAAQRADRPVSAGRPQDRADRGAARRPGADRPPWSSYARWCCARAAARSTEGSRSTGGWRPRAANAWSPGSGPPFRSPTSSSNVSAASLAARLGHPVQLNVELAPDLVGGLTVRVGDVLFDGSIAHRLALARRVMTG